MAAVVARIPTKSLPARSLSSLSSPHISLSAAGGEAAPAAAAPVLDLDDTGRLFVSCSTGALVRSLANLYAMACGPFVDLGTAAMRSEALMSNRLSRAAIVRAVRATAYRHFCAGEEAEEAARTVRDMWEGKGIRGILDFGLEDADDHAACDRSLGDFLRTVEIASSLPPTSASVCIKITALCPISVLERASDLLRWEHKDPSFNLPWKTHSFPILSDSSPLYLTPAVPLALTESEERELRMAHERLSTICRRCAEAGISLFIDAEYCSLQPAIDYLTSAAALEFNRPGGRPVVFATLQAYLRDARERLEGAAVAAGREGIPLGLKLVRGAYLTRETRLASSLAVPSPIHRGVEETHECYNSCARFMLERIAGGSGDAVVLATHNVESGKLAARKAVELGIGKEDQRLQFAQLMGMAEGLSLGLRNAGFQVNKYLPFGPVDQVIPYLLRRAEENRGFLSTASLDRQLMRKEVMRRAGAKIVGRAQG